MFTAIAAVATIGVTGIYFETRTCSIYAGPCHYNSEIMTDGRGAIVALGFESGQGLDGLAAAAVVLGDVNLNLSANRQAVIYIDSAATEEQGQRMTDYLKPRAGLGSVVSVQPAQIQLEVSGLDSELRVSAGGITVIAAETNSSECHTCSMAGVLWFKPLVLGTKVDVATVQRQSFCDPLLGETWSRGEESAAFVGTFAW